MNKKTKKIYKLHLKLVKEKSGFFPEDFKESLKHAYNALEKYYFKINKG